MEAAIFFVALGAIGFAVRSLYRDGTNKSRSTWILIATVVCLLTLAFTASDISGGSGIEAGIFFSALGIIGLVAKGIYFADPPISHRGWIMAGAVVFALVMVFVASLISGSSPALGYISLMFMLLAVPAILLGACVQAIVWFLKRRRSDSPSTNE